jgi:lysylphosphatidylglycerol synthetase-like protein (DUF2156 family)
MLTWLGLAAGRALRSFSFSWSAGTSFIGAARCLSGPLRPGSFLAIGIVLGSALWLGLFSYKQVGYSDQLRWQFALYGDARAFCGPPSQLR